MKVITWTDSNDVLRVITPQYGSMRPAEFDAGSPPEFGTDGALLTPEVPPKEIKAAETEAEFLDRVRLKSIPSGGTFRGIVEDTALPSTDADAWRWDEATGAIITDTAAELAKVKAAATARIKKEAETERQKYITAGDGKAQEYQQKTRELEAYDAVVAASGTPSAADYPLVAAEATALGVTLTENMTRVRTAYASWKLVGAFIAGKEAGAVGAIKNADSVSAVETAATVDWSLPA